MRDIVVVGSINMDVVNNVKNHPKLGETIEGRGTEYHPGGKGANQAIAARLAGGRVRMIGAVGEDTFASELIVQLNKFEVDTELVLRKSGSTGLAFITVDEKAENTIILSSGANARFSPTDIQSTELRRAVSAASLVILQNEIPWETTYLAMKIAKDSGARVIFNPAPAMGPVEDLFSMVDLMILNESETSLIAGLPVQTREDAELAAQSLVQAGLSGVVITLGDKGAVYMDSSSQILYTPAFRVSAVDSTAAGDTFIGYLATAIWSGEPMEGALRHASAASAISVMRKGAQDSIPVKNEVDTFLHTINLST